MSRFTHLFRRFFGTEKRTPQNESLLKCMHHTKVGAVRGGKSASISSGTQAGLQTTSGGIDFTEAVILIVKIYHHNTDTDDILSYFHRVKDPS